MPRMLFFFWGILAALLSSCLASQPSVIDRVNCTREVIDQVQVAHQYLEAVIQNSAVKKPVKMVIERRTSDFAPGSSTFYFKRSVRIYEGVDEVFSFTQTLNGDVLNTVINIRNIHLTTETSIITNVTTGSMDGREFIPFVAELSKSTSYKLQFQDGKPAPQTEPLCHIESSVLSLTKHLEELKVQTPCSPFDAYNNTNGDFNGVRRFNKRQNLDFSQDPGHFSDTYGDSPCKTCKGGVYAGEVVALAGCTAACIFSFGIACGPCYAAAGVGVVTGLLACQHSGFCCPVNCYRSDILGPGPCCFGDETCLDHAGRCCGPTQQACGGKTCCNSGQSCISQGLDKGTCCPDSVPICNGKCCSSEMDVCIPDLYGVQVCCSRAYHCGTVCCDDPTGVLGARFACVDPTISLCCLPYQINVGGVCCDSGQINCGGSCCSGSCVNGVCRQNSEFCLANGGVGEVCVYGSPSGSPNDCPQSAFLNCYPNGCCYRRPS